MATEIRFDHKMSDAEALMWRIDKDPYLSSTFANLSVLDRSPDFDRLRRRMERATFAIPRLRQRVQSAPANLTPPLWVEDPDFDIDYHVRRIALPRPGSMRQLLDLATLIVNDPFDRTRPLWQFVVIEGLADDRAVLVEKLHHTIADGEGSIQLSLQFFDFARDAPEPPPISAHSRDQDSTHEHGSSDLWRDVLAGPLKLPLALVKHMRELIADPTQVPAAGAATIDTLRALIGQMADVEPAKSPLWTQRSLRRRIEVLKVPFVEARSAARVLGGTLNTLLLTAASDAAGRYHRALGSPVPQLRASMAISTRAKGDDSANAFSLARMLVPTVEMSVADRFRAIHEITTEAASGSAANALNAIASVAGSLPTGITTRLARLQSQTVDFATSNVKGTPQPVYVAGSEILSNFPVGPLGGVAFNLTLLSHVGSLDMGLNMDTRAIAEPSLLTESLEASLADILSLAR
jgi:diacylglycerol O-acyltransferase